MRLTVEINIFFFAVHDCETPLASDFYKIDPTCDSRMPQQLSKCDSVAFRGWRGGVEVG